MTPLRISVCRVTALDWKVELWRPREPRDPPPPNHPIGPLPFGPDWTRISLAGATTRRGARRRARKLIEAYYHPPVPFEDCETWTVPVRPDTPDTGKVTV